MASGGCSDGWACMGLDIDAYGAAAPDGSGGAATRWMPSQPPAPR
jgi:hypothetical protein